MDRLLTVDLTTELARHRRWPNSTLNDLLVATMQLAIEEWNYEHNESANLISVAVPVNARPDALRSEILANLAPVGRVFSSSEERRNLPRLLSSVSEQSAFIRSDVVQLMTNMPALTQHFLLTLMPILGFVVSCSTIVTNIGRIDDPLNFGACAGEMEKLWFAPPVGMPMGLSLGAATVAGRLHLSIRYRHALLDARAASSFLDLFVNVLLNVCGIDSSSSVKAVVSPQTASG